MWTSRYERFSEAELINKKPIPKTHLNGIAPEIQEKVIYLRKKYHLGPDRIHMYLQRYHPDIKVSVSSVYRICRRHGLSRLPRNTRRRALATQRYEKQVPGHHIQVDVKFLSSQNRDGKKTK